MKLTARKGQVQRVITAPEACSIEEVEPIIATPEAGLEHVEDVITALEADPQGVISAPEAGLIEQTPIFPMLNYDQQGLPDTPDAEEPEGALEKPLEHKGDDQVRPVQKAAKRLWLESYEENEDDELIPDKEPVTRKGKGKVTQDIHVSQGKMKPPGPVYQGRKAAVKPIRSIIDLTVKV